MTDYEIFRNSVIRKFVDYSSRMHLNCIRHDPNASDSHCDKVEEVCRLLRKNEIDFICRPILTYYDSTLIPDILAFTFPKASVIEVIESETIEHIEEKFDKYPDDLKKIYLKPTDDINKIGLI